MSAGRPSRRARPGRAALLAAGLLVLLVAVVPPLRARAVAVPATADALGLPFPRPLAVEVARRPTAVGGVPADRYGREGSADPTVVLVPGATPEGRDDRRVIRLATAVARSGRTVVVPELQLYEPTLVPADLDRIAAVVEAAGEDAPITVLGISYGGSVALRTFGDRPALQDRVSLVVVFGAYADLAGVLQGAATGVVELDGERFAWSPDARAQSILRAEVLGAVPDDVAAAARSVLDGERDVGAVPAEAAAVVELLRHDDPDRTAAIVAALPAGLRDRIRAMSPVHVAGDIQLPVRILHARDDPAVPYAEGRRLAATLPDARLTTVDSFSHVDLELGSPGELWTAATDLVGVWRLTGALLAAQEPWLPARAR